MAFWANLIGYQATWLAVVCSAGSGMPWIGMLACVVFIALQWSASRTRAGDSRVLVAALACGIVVDGVASTTGLLAYAARCGVGASTSVLKKYGISVTNLLGTAGPDKLVNQFAKGLGDEHGRVRLHFYPFGGMTKTLEWIRDYNAKHGI